MNIYPFLHFFAFLVYLYLIIVILIKDPKSWLNRSCAVLLACFVVWSFGSIFIYNPRSSKDTVMLFDNVASIGWISFTSFFLWFALIFTEKKKILKTRIIYPLIFILPFLLIYKQWTGFLTVDYIKQPWGWGSVWSDSIWAYLFYLYYLSFMAIGLYLILNFGRKTEEPLKKKQAKIIFVAALVSLVFSTLTDVILPELNIRTIPSSLGNVITFIWASGIVYAIAKYKLMVITPVAAADNIISTMADSLILLDRQGNIASVNKAVLDLSGYGEDELKEKSVEIFFREKDFKSTLLDRAIKKEAIINYELNFKTKTGDNIPVLFSSSSMMDEAGGMVGIVCIVKDITERKNMLDKLKNSEEEYRNLFENMPGAYYRTDREGNLIMINPEGAKLFGYNSFEDILGKNIAQHFYFTPEERKKHLKELEKNKGNLKDFELTLKKKDGTLLVISDTSHYYYDEKGNIIGVEGIFVDITERKEAEMVIIYEQSLLHALMENIPDFIYFKDEKNRFVRVNKASGEDRGITPEDFIGKTDFDIFTEEAAKKCFADDDRVMKTGKPLINRIEKITYLNGMERWFSATKVPRYDEKGKIIGTIGITRDITERKQAEENVKNAKDELQIILDSAPAIIFYKNTEGKIIRANKALADLLRLPVRDIIGKTAEDIFSNEQAEKMRKDDREIIISGKPKRGIIQPHPTPDGLRFLISDKIPYRDKKGKITGVIVLAKDITVQRKSEQELQQTFQRLKKTMDAAIDTMSRIIEAKDPYTSGQPAPGLPISHPYCPRDETS
jgi:PAS domain S-box-containing protein